MSYGLCRPVAGPLFARSAQAQLLVSGARKFGPGRSWRGPGPALMRPSNPQRCCEPRWGKARESRSFLASRRVVALGSKQRNQQLVVFEDFSD